jgi:hypothetical protein
MMPKPLAANKKKRNDSLAVLDSKKIHDTDDDTVDEATEALVAFNVTNTQPEDGDGLFNGEDLVEFAGELSDLE